MRTIERTGAFKRDYKRIAKGPRRETVLAALTDVIARLAENGALEVRHRDHALTGDWRDHRDCHVLPDLVLIYRLPDVHTLQLVRLGSHSELNL